MSETTEKPVSPVQTQKSEILKALVDNMLAELKNGNGDRDRRRQVEDWLKSVGEKYPAFEVEKGLREYYFAEATRLRGDFEKSTDLIEKLNLSKQVEMFLDKASD